MDGLTHFGLKLREPEPQSLDYSHFGLRQCPVKYWQPPYQLCADRAGHTEPHRFIIRDRPKAEGYEPIEPLAAEDF